MNPLSASEVLVLVTLTVTGAAYGRGCLLLWRRAGAGQVVTSWQVFSFYLGLLTVLASVASPLDGLAHTLFAGHMAQHMLLVLVAAPLLAFGMPALTTFWALPARLRRPVAGRWRRSRLRRPASFLTHPLLVWTSFAVVLWTWHLPSLYQLAVARPSVHAAEHGTLLIASFLFWSLLIQPLGPRRLTPGSALLFLFTTSLHVTLLGALISLAPRPLYPIYEAGSRLIGISAIEDQRLAALVMRTPMMLVFLVSVAALFLGWLAAMERRAGPDPAERRPVTRAAPAPSDHRS